MKKNLLLSSCLVALSFLVGCAGSAQDGEDLFKLLKRTYGAGVQGLPRFYVLSALQSVNAGVVLEHLNAGDKVRIPKLSY